jgi:shikimate dehydrogenase
MNSTIPLAGVIGFPVSHSKSPRLHGHWLANYGIMGHYVPLHVAPENLANTLKSMPNMGFVGCNVTIPHKEAALALAQHVTDTARRIGAANTLVFKDGEIYADNTDGIGFIENLRQNAPKWRADTGPALVIGAGGAARAILVALLDGGAPVVLWRQQVAVVYPDVNAREALQVVVKLRHGGVVGGGEDVGGGVTDFVEGGHGHDGKGARS